ncbi:uncharacterized protein LOC127800002 isoform X2 [Diospyros lotus]|uniref:uncharacterized protein LOC127800002 isoform X2 n=1 Tax=Diospyros lotus TaxID=55363 RepID=UPI0022536EA8|nr:uncharacterized protein LOC127800002 isoform X2 [Diospyros lotus]
MGDEKDAFYVVRKGDIIGFYKNLDDCQAVIGSAVCDPSVTVFKGFCLPKEAEDYLASHGLKNAVYSIKATDLRDDVFGQLAVCPFQQPASAGGKALGKSNREKRLQHEVFGSTSFSATSLREQLEFHHIPSVFFHHEVFGSTSSSATPPRKQAKLQNSGYVPTNYYPGPSSCILEFDGASKGNPGLAGAGAVLHAEGGMVYRVREGVGIATNNVAEYRGVILGLNYALKKGFKHIRVQGDSKLVCMQVQGLWKTKNPNMTDLCKVAKELKDKFMSFEIRHVERI